MLMLTAIILWYITIGLVVATYNRINYDKLWKKAVKVFGMIYLRIGYDPDRSSIDRLIICLITVFWLPIITLNIINIIRWKTTKLVKKIKRRFL